MDPANTAAQFTVPSSTHGKRASGIGPNDVRAGDVQVPRSTQKPTSASDDLCGVALVVADPCFSRGEPKNRIRHLIYEAVGTAERKNGRAGGRGRTEVNPEKSSSCSMLSALLPVIAGNATDEDLDAKAGVDRPTPDISNRYRV